MTLEAWVNPTSMNGWETVALQGTRRRRHRPALLCAVCARRRPTATRRPAGYVRTSAGAVRTAASRAAAAAAEHLEPHRGHLQTAAGGSTLRFYVNGALVTTVTGANQNILAGNQPLRIGSSNAPISEGFFNGLIDEVRVYNRALSAAEITADMTTPVVQ